MEKGKNIRYQNDECIFYGINFERCIEKNSLILCVAIRNKYNNKNLTPTFSIEDWDYYQIDESTIFEHNNSDLFANEICKKIMEVFVI